MCSFRPLIVVFLVLCLRPGLSAAESDGYILGFGGEADTAGGRAASAFGEFGMSRKTWLSAMLAKTKTVGTRNGLDTLYADLGIDHWFEPMGFRLGGGYWGDRDILDSNDLRGSIYFKNDAMSISANYELRYFDLVINSDLLPEPRVVEFEGDGYGLTTRFDINDVISVSLGGMSYDYSRNINLQPYIDVLRIFIVSRLGLMNSLLDYRYSAGIDWKVGTRNFDIRIERWQTAVDQGRVDSIGVGFLTPFGDRGDIEFRLAYDESDQFGGSVAASVFYYFFGD